MCCVRPDGEVVCAHVEVNAEFDDAGEVTGWIGFIADFTELQRAREELQRMHDALEAHAHERTQQWREMALASLDDPFDLIVVGAVTDDDRQILVALNPRTPGVMIPPAERLRGGGWSEDERRTFAISNLPGSASPTPTGAHCPPSRARVF